MKNTFELRYHLKEERHRVKQALGAMRGTTVITLIDHHEPWGGQEDTKITIEDSEYVLSQLHAIPPTQPLDLVIHTPGGLALSAQIVAKAVREHPAPVTAFVPFYAMSGGTLIALAADVICMETFSVLGPVDPQIDGFPALSYIRLLERKPVESISDTMLIKSDIASMSRTNMMQFVEQLVSDRLLPNAAQSLSDFLTGGHLTHSTPITPEVMQSFGIPIEIGVPDMVYEFFHTMSFGQVDRPALTPPARV